MHDLVKEACTAAPLAERRFVPLAVLDKSQRNVVRQDGTLEVDHVGEGRAATLAGPDFRVLRLKFFVWFHVVASTRRPAGLLLLKGKKPEPDVVVGCENWLRSSHVAGRGKRASLESAGHRIVDRLEYIEGISGRRGEGEERGKRQRDA